MNGEDVVVDSANAAANTVATDLFEKLTKHALNLTGAEICQHLDSTDGPGLFSPLEVVTDGKDRLGAILTLEDRAILGWTVGTLRIKNFEAVIPYGSIESLELGTRPGGPMSKDRETLRIKTDSQTWELVFANAFEGGRSIVPFIKGVLEGSIKPVFEVGTAAVNDTGGRSPLTDATAAGASHAPSAKQPPANETIQASDEIPPPMAVDTDIGGTRFFDLAATVADTDSVESAKLKCSSCGAEIAADDSYCSSCGEELNTP